MRWTLPILALCGQQLYPHPPEAAKNTGGLRLQRCEALSKYDTLLWAQSQRHHITNRLEERGAEKSMSFLERMRKGHHQSDKHYNCSKATLGKLLRDRVDHICIPHSTQLDRKESQSNLSKNDFKNGVGEKKRQQVSCCDDLYTAARELCV